MSRSRSVRLAEVRMAIKACGQSLGRPFKLTAHQRSEAIVRRAESATLKELAESYDVGLAMISRLAA